jgi:hypothetical protein
MKLTIDPTALEKILNHATRIVGHVDAIDDALVIGDLTLASSATPMLSIAAGGSR